MAFLAANPFALRDLQEVCITIGNAVLPNVYSYERVVLQAMKNRHIQSFTSPCLSLAFMTELRAEFQLLDVSATW